MSVSMLESYRGRDKIMRTVQFGSLMSSGLLSRLTPSNAAKLKAIAGHLGSGRLLLRLFDDIPMLAYNLYAGGLGQKESNPTMRFLSLIKGCIDQLFYPSEHIAWAAENKLIDINSGIWWLLSVALWGMSLIIDIIRNCIKLQQQNQKTAKYRQDLRSEQPSTMDGHHVAPTSASELQRLEAEKSLIRQQIIKSLCDLCCAIHWSKPGFLWASKLPDSVVGLLGTVSSLLGMHAHIVQMRNQKKVK